MITYFNNKFSNNKNILIDVRDRGFLLGDAVFETILFNNKKIILFNYHYERFIKSIKNNYFNFFISKIRIKTSDIKRLSNSILSQNKTSNYFENIVAKHISKKEKFDDALFLNEKNKICCCSSSNIYFVENNKIFTPPLKDGALDGTVRKLLLKKKKVAVKSISLNNLKKVREVFLTNSILGVRPVTKIDKISFDFGPKTKTIMKYLESLGI